MAVLKKIGLFVHKNKVEIRAIFCVILALILVLAIEGFRISFSKITEIPTAQSRSRVEGNTVYVDDEISDLYYYNSLDYTESSTGTLTNGTDQNIYNNTNMVKATITYSGTDPYETSLVGYVGLQADGELQNTYIYYKYYPKTNGYITVELIDNPFTNRPTNKGFAGWVPNNENVVITLDRDYYKRYARIPVTGNEVSVTFNARWLNANVANITTNSNTTWSNAFSELENYGMNQIGGHVTEYEDITQFYTYGGRISNRSYYPDNSYNYAGTSVGGTRCSAQGGWGGSNYCYYYYKVTENNYDPNANITYYEPSTGYYSTQMTVHNVQLLRDEDVPYLTQGTVLAGYYEEVNINRNQSFTNLYNEYGELIESGTCTTQGGCTYYNMISYLDNNDNVNTADGQTVYYRFITRDMNIIVMQRNNLQYRWASGQNKPFTLTSVHNGTDYRNTNTAYWNVSSSGAVTCYNDTRIENITIYSNDSSAATSPSSSASAAGYMYANYQNLKIGRGVTQRNSSKNFDVIIGGNNATGSLGSASDVTKYHLNIESGYYNTISLTNGSYSNNYSKYIEAKATYGNDYDRVEQDNTKLDVYWDACGTFGGGNYYASNETTAITMDTLVKSGKFGSQKGTDHTAGIYVGGRGYNNIYAVRRIKVEGGWIYNLIGGPLTGTNRTSINDIYIYMTGGAVDMIIGGAGTSATYGNRIVSVTGGTVSYSVFGGSNGYDGDSGDGTLNGSSFVYVGGNAVIGSADGLADTDGLWNAEAGSVFGIGNGKSGTSSIGSNDNSNVMITEKALINRNVYGGGNFGATGISSTSNTNTTNIWIDGGNIQGSVYGGGNNNATYTTSKTSTVNIMMTSGSVAGSVYGGANINGTIYGNTNVTVTGGKISNSVYGGGQGGISSGTIGTYVTGNVKVTIGSPNTDNGLVIIENSVYGGSAFGTVNGGTNTTSVSSASTTVTINSGSITNVFGGGQGDSTHTPYVEGNVTVNVEGGIITNVFGGNDLRGTPNGSVIVNINNGTVTNAYGGGNQTEVTEPYLNLLGGTVTNAYGGGNNAGVTTSHVTLNGSTCTKVFGGSNSSGTVTTSNVTCTSGTATSVYGGNNLGGTTGTTNVLINGGSITNAFGGGESTNVTTQANITLNGQVSYLYGGSNSSGTVTSTNVSVTGNAIDVFGGNNLGGTSITTNVSVTGGTTTNIYGGGKSAETTTSTVTFSSGTTTNIFGGGSEAGVTTTNVIAQSGTATNIFGGSNTSGNVTTSNVTCNNVTATNVFGGNNLGGTTGTTNVVINGNNVTNAYGGGESTNVTTSTNITLNGQVTNMFGGSDSSGTVTLTNVNVRGTATEVYGGNNLGGTSVTTNVVVDNGTTNTIYGGGKKAETTSSTITFNSGTSTYVFGGGSEAGVTTTNVKLGTGTITSAFGGSNTSGTVSTSNISNINGTATQSGTLSVTNIFGGNNQGGTTGTANISLSRGNITNVYGGGERAETNLTNVNITGATINRVVYGGGDNADVTTNTNVSITSNSRILGTVYGGGNAGEVDGNTNVNVTSSTITQNIYGGGNAASIKGSTNVDVTSSTITGSIFGGGNNGMVLNDTDVDIKNTTVSESIYAGGNGVTAIVLGDTLLNIEGTTNVTNHVFGGGNAAATGCNADITNGSNEVIAICSDANSSHSEVNIAGATIGGNVYGGANTSVLYGVTTVNIGTNTIDSNYNLTSGNISINGTVFGGGEANASGSEDYDFSFISVTTGININIDAANHNTFTINGSIFGSGNASSSGGYSYINIKNYGTSASPKANVSIQRTDIVTLDNSSIILAGATDRTNKYKSELFTFSRIGELKLKNGSTIYLTKGANLLEKFSSLVDVNGSEVKETVSISDQDGSVTRNVDNRVYMYEGTNLNISDDESLATYGDVNGMAFFGMFNKDRNGNIVTALYSGEYNAGDTTSSAELYYFSSGSYVIGKHKSNHNYYVDGFYTHYADEDGETVNVDYIIPTPESASFYRWIAGESVESLEVNLTASKYSTLGTYELQLLDYYAPNTEIDVLGVSFINLNANINLLPSSSIPRHADTVNAANTNFGLAMKTGTTGWITNGETEFLTSGTQNVSGTEIYKAENSNAIPSLVFYFYHSKNLTLTQDLGSVIISLMVLTPNGDLAAVPHRINIVVNLNSTLYEGDNYEAAISPGDKYEMFANNAVNITNKSTFSTYFSLYSSSTVTIYGAGYYRTLVSSYALPVNTKITMIDLAESDRPEYYYYIINQSDYNSSLTELSNQGEISYKLSKFIKMDSSSTNNTYNDASANTKYYDQTKQTAEEEFIFIIDLKDANLSTDVLGESLLLELRNSNDNPQIPVLDIEQRRMVYNLYNNKDAVINATATLSSNNIYIGKTTNLNVVTSFAQQTINDTTIIDTNFYDQKLGIKITLLDDTGRVVNGASLLGLNYEYDGVIYYPRTDGTTRFNIAERVANVSSRIKINTAGSNLATGNYTILIDTFGSSDGIYYGLESSSQIRINISIINDIYGLSVNLNDSDVIIDADTGLSQDSNNSLDFTINYSSGLSNPNIRLSVHRRTYTEIYRYTYNLIDYNDLFSTELTPSSNTNEYIITTTPISANRVILNTKAGLTTGTYRLEFKLYDNNIYIGSAYKDIIVLKK